MQKIRAKLIMLVVAAAFGGVYASPAVADEAVDPKEACGAAKDLAQEGTEAEKEAAEQTKEECDAAVEAAEAAEQEPPEEEVDQD
jgi:hypothetical protein